jgi:hypothetical protein
MFAIEAADGSFANVSQQTADWALSRSNKLPYLFDDDVSCQFKIIGMVIHFLIDNNALSRSKLCYEYGSNPCTVYYYDTSFVTIVDYSVSTIKLS